jgi:hypothetical protein
MDNTQCAVTLPFYREVLFDWILFAFGCRAVWCITLKWFLALRKS